MVVVDKKEKIPTPRKRTIMCLEGSALRGKYCHIPILAAESPTQTRRIPNANLGYLQKEFPRTMDMTLAHLMQRVATREMRSYA